MQFVRLDSGFYLDLSIMQISEAAEVAFVRSIAYAGKAESSGFIPQEALASLIKRYAPAKGRKVATELVQAQLWVPVNGGWQLRTWGKHQKELEALLQRRRSDAERQRRHRDKTAEPESSSRDMSRDESRNGSRDESRNSLSRESESEDKDEVQNPSSLTVVCRLISGDAHATTTDDDLARWQEWAGPSADLEYEARAFIDHNFGVDLRSPPRAWRGWLLTAAKRTADQPIPIPKCHRCKSTGWLPDNDEGQAVRCPCRIDNVTPISAAASAGAAS